MNENKLTYIMSLYCSAHHGISYAHHSNYITESFFLSLHHRNEHNTITSSANTSALFLSEEQTAFSAIKRKITSIYIHLSRIRKDSKLFFCLAIPQLCGFANFVLLGATSQAFGYPQRCGQPNSRKTIRIIKHGRHDKPQRIYIAISIRKTTYNYSGLYVLMLCSWFRLSPIPHRCGFRETDCYLASLSVSPLSTFRSFADSFNASDFGLLNSTSLSIASYLIPASLSASDFLLSTTLSIVDL